MSQYIYIYKYYTVCIYIYIYVYMCNDMDDVSENMVQHGTRRQNPCGLLVSSPRRHGLKRWDEEHRSGAGQEVALRAPLGYIDFI